MEFKQSRRYITFLHIENFILDICVNLVAASLENILLLWKNFHFSGQVNFLFLQMKCNLLQTNINLSHIYFWFNKEYFISRKRKVYLPRISFNINKKFLCVYMIPRRLTNIMSLVQVNLTILRVPGEFYRSDGSKSQSQIADMNWNRGYEMYKYVDSFNCFLTFKQELGFGNTYDFKLETHKLRSIRRRQTYQMNWSTVNSPCLIRILIVIKCRAWCAILPICIFPSICINICNMNSYHIN